MAPSYYITKLLLLYFLQTFDRIYKQNSSSGDNIYYPHTSKHWIRYLYYLLCKRKYKKKIIQMVKLLLTFCNILAEHKKKYWSFRCIRIKWYASLFSYKHEKYLWFVYVNPTTTNCTHTHRSLISQFEITHTDALLANTNVHYVMVQEREMCA